MSNAAVMIGRIKPRLAGRTTVIVFHNNHNNDRFIKLASGTLNNESRDLYRARGPHRLVA